MSNREDFEEAAARLSYNLAMRDVDSEDGEYLIHATQRAWDMWQECCALKAKAKPIGVIKHNTHPVSDNPDAYVEWLFGGDTCNIAEGTKLYTQPQSAVVPEGWKLVPIVSTSEMDIAAHDKGIMGVSRDEAEIIWNVMLHAAPQPPQEGE